MSTMMSSSSTAVAKSQAQVIAVVFPLRIGGRAVGAVGAAWRLQRGAAGCAVPWEAARLLCLPPLSDRNR